MTHKVYYIIMIVLMGGYASALCQIKKSESREAYQKRLHQEELDKYDLNESKLDNLSRIGVDLRIGKLKSREMARAAYSDAVVVAKITGIIGWPGSREQLFHSKVTVRIEEVLKGKAIVGKTIELFEESGPLTDSTKIIVSDEPSFDNGGEYILYLRRMNKDRYLTSPFHKNSFESGHFDSDSVHFYIGAHSSVPIQNGKVFLDFTRSPEDVAQLKADIKQVATAVE